MFSNRSKKKELLDAEGIPAEDLYLNLKELDTINLLLGGYSISFNALKRVMTQKKQYTIVDIGCGGGDTLKRIDKWNQKQKFKLRLMGIDLKQTCIDYCKNNRPNSDIEFICDDYRNMYSYAPNIDLIHACLFCHHLSDDEIVNLIQFAQKNKSTLVINDLQRHPIAYFAIKWLTYFLSTSYLVKNDAPLSVLRGFRKKELQAIIKRSGARNFKLRYKWAFRYQVIVYA
jgi:2-polyprenyl-3-methyl-5-hydroxy-6-metoxy-1,4-benzoquinol methylase